MKQNTHSHPLQLIDLFATQLSENAKLEFGIYQYKPQSIADRRKLYRVPISKAKDWYLTKATKLGAGQEIAIQSRIYGEVQGTLHIPMIDFLPGISKRNMQTVQLMLEDFKIKSCFIYWSGRSFHLYGYPFIKDEHFNEFLGRLLLLNLPNKKSVIDTRWVGHRLMAGYTALRWTANTKYYLAEPDRRCSWETMGKYADKYPSLKRRSF